MRIEAAVETDHQHDAGAPDGIQAGPHPWRRQVDRLLAEDRPAGGGGTLDVVGVRRRRRADQHRIGRERRIQGQRLRAALAGQTLRRVRIDVGHAGQAHPGARGDVARMDAADPARANHCDAQHPRLPFPPAPWENSNEPATWHEGKREWARSVSPWRRRWYAI
jgi:hypothetical protein